MFRKYTDKILDENTIQGTKDILIIIAMSVLIGLFVVSCFPSVEYDSTDDIENNERSGLVLYTDHGTGCQYLEGGHVGGLTPRVNGKGEHMGCKE